MLKRLQSKKGQGLVEYALIIGAVALIAIIAVSILGNKTADIIGTLAVILPGAQDSDEGRIVNAQIVETTRTADGDLVLDATRVSNSSDTSRLATNLGISSELMDQLVGQQGIE